MSLTQRIIKTAALALFLAASINADASGFHHSKLGWVVLQENTLTIGGASEFSNLVGHIKNAPPRILTLTGVPDGTPTGIDNEIINGVFIEDTTENEGKKSILMKIWYSKIAQHFIIILPSGNTSAVAFGAITSVEELEARAAREKESAPMTLAELAQKSTPVTLEP